MIAQSFPIDAESFNAITMTVLRTNKQTNTCNHKQ